MVMVTQNMVLAERWSFPTNSAHALAEMELYYTPRLVTQKGWLGCSILATENWMGQLGIKLKPTKLCNSLQLATHI